MSGQKKVKRTKTQGDEKNTSNSAASLQVPVVDSFLLEEEEAEKGDALQELNMFKNKCGEIREHAKEIVKLKKTKESEEELAKHRILASILFTDLKKLNRLDKHRCKNARDAVNEVKQKVDNFHLQLQNLMYEVMHLQKEVTKCLEFRSKDEEIDLVPEKEFFSEAPEAITKPLMSVQEESSKEKHRLTLARLEWELEQRKRLAEKLKETENMKQIYQQEIEKKKECLDNLKPRLKTILEATEPLHEELGIPLQATQLHHKGTELLSRPLYVLYVQAFAYKEVYDKQLEVKMEGNVEEARALQTTTQENTEEDSGESDQDDAPRVKHRRRPSAKGTESVPPPKKVLTRHPLTVRIMVSTSEGAALVLQFSFLTVLHIVTVKVKLTQLHTTGGIAASEILKQDTLLKYLFPEDSGEILPNPANLYQLKKEGIEDIHQIIEEAGYPYHWVQRVAGLEFLYVPNDVYPHVTPKVNNFTSSSHMDQTIKAIRSRLSARLSLYKLLLSLEQLNVPVLPEISALYPHKVIAKLKEWSKIPWSDIKEKEDCMELLELGVISEEWMSFRTVVERGSATLWALVLVPPNYPERASLFLLSLDWKQLRTSRTDKALQELEHEINMSVVNFIPQKVRYNLLACQLHHLLVGFDVYLETDPDATEGPKEFSQGKIFLRIARGRDRRRPYKYVAKLGLFTHR